MRRLFLILLLAGFVPAPASPVSAAPAPAVAVADADQGGTREVPWSYRQRPAVKVGVDAEGVATISNVRWGFDETKDAAGRNLPKWRTVKVDPRHAVKAFFALKLFAPEWLAAHGLIIYRFDPAHPVTTEFGETSKGFCVSVEAYLREDQKFDLMKGLKKSWPNVWQLSSYEDYVQHCAITNQRMLIYELDLTPEQVGKMLAASLERSFQDHLQDYYNTLTNSCFTNQIQAINGVVPESQRIREYLIPKVVINPLASLPRTLGFVLKRHGLLRGREISWVARDKNKADIATKELTGAAREEALRKLGPIVLQATKVENRLADALLGGNLPPEAARVLLYDEVSRYSPWLHVPGTVPGEANNGEVTLGEKFGADLAAAKTPAMMVNILKLGFAEYRRGLEKRVLLEGPEVFGFVGNRLADLERRVAEIVKTAELYAR